MMRTLFCTLMVGLTLVISAQATNQVTRPPQFVLLAFDNCSELSRWESINQFLVQQNQQVPNRIHFTFFVSGTNFLTDNQRTRYQGPGKAPGAAEIPFGGSADTLMARLKIMHQLYRQGHEFGSHAVGHFDGTHWTTAQWNQEFSSYQRLFTQIQPNNQLKLPFSTPYPLREVVGFRAPYLGESPAVYPTLKRFGFRYDASGVSKSTLWPQKKQGIWLFDLVPIKLHGTQTNVLSMDYNIMLEMHPRHLSKSAAVDYLVATYLDYFMANYTGNRAPIKIGHHFQVYDNDAYYSALLKFARTVCYLPEVACISHRELADFMDPLSNATIQAYQAGNFPRAKKPKLPTPVLHH